MLKSFSRTFLLRENEKDLQHKMFVLNLTFSVDFNLQLISSDQKAVQSRLIMVIMSLYLNLNQKLVTTEFLDRGNEGLLRWKISRSGFGARAFVIHKNHFFKLFVE